MARDGHKEAAAIVDDAVNYLAMGIANLTHIINPSVFVLGGGVMLAQNQLSHPERKS